MSVGIAILDINGNLISLSSKRDIKRNEVIKFIAEFGKPLIIASDVNPLPRSVERLASTFGSKAYFPETSLSVVEKQELTKEFSDIIKNSHESDALSASIKAWKKYRDLFSKVDNTLKDLGLPELFEDVVSKLLKEGSDNIDDAIKKILSTKMKKQEPVKKKSMTLKDHRDMIEQLKKRLAQKEDYIQILLQQANRLNKVLLNARSDIKLMEEIKLNFSELIGVKKEIMELKEANELLKKFRKIEESGFKPVIEIEKIEGSILEDIDRKIGLENQVVFVNSIENLNLLNNFKIKAVIVKFLPKEDVIAKLEFPLVLYEEGQISIVEGIKCMKKDDLDEKIKESRKTGLVEWLKDYKKRKD